MKVIHRTKIVGDLLLEWRTRHCLVNGIASGVYVYEQDEGDWKECLELSLKQADELQLALREAVLEIEAAIEKDTEAKACSSEPKEDLPEPDPFPEGDTGESTIGD